MKCPFSFYTWSITDSLSYRRSYRKDKELEYIVSSKYMLLQSSKETVARMSCCSHTGLAIGQFLRMCRLFFSTGKVAGKESVLESGPSNSAFVTPDSA